MPRRKGALFLPLDVMFMEDDKILAAGESASWLYLAMCCRSKQLMTDGVLTRQQIERLQVKGWQKRLTTCVEVGLVAPLDDDDDRYWITGWLRHNDPAEIVAERWKKDADRARERRASGRASEPTRDGHPNRRGSESGLQEEKSREEKRSGRVGPDGFDPDGFCFVHGKQDCWACAA